VGRARAAETRGEPAKKTRGPRERAPPQRRIFGHAAIVARGRGRADARKEKSTRSAGDERQRARGRGRGRARAGARARVFRDGGLAEEKKCKGEEKKKAGRLRGPERGRKMRAAAGRRGRFCATAWR